MAAAWKVRPGPENDSAPRTALCAGKRCKNPANAQELPKDKRVRLLHSAHREKDSRWGQQSLPSILKATGSISSIIQEASVARETPQSVTYLLYTC